MGVIRKRNPETGRWEVYGSSEASDINLIDIGDNFTDKNVEGALREISDKLSESMADVDAQRAALVEHSNTLATYNNVLREHASAIEWLRENGGGGGGGGNGAAAPTITSTFEDGTIVTKEEEVAAVFAECATVTGFYSYKAKAENEIKLDTQRKLITAIIRE